MKNSGLFYFDKSSELLIIYFLILTDSLNLNTDYSLKKLTFKIYHDMESSDTQQSWM